MVEDDVQRAIAEWRARAVAEHRSAAEAARLLHLMVALGVDRLHIDALLRTVQDELDHAELALRVSASLGGPDAPVDVDLRLLAPVGTRGPLGDALLLCLQELCIGETLAVPLFRSLRAGTTHPVARAALDRILRDEPRHQRWAWRHLDALLAIDAVGGRALLNGALEAILARFAGAYGEVPLGLHASPAALALGLMPGEAWQRSFWSCWHRSLRPRLDRRGLAAPAFCARAADRGTLRAWADGPHAACAPSEPSCV